MNQNQIVGIWTIRPEEGGAIDILLLRGGRVVAITGEGIELWPNEHEFLAADPQGDYAEMLGFIEYEPAGGTLEAQGSVIETARFGRTQFVPICLSHIREYVLGRFELADGSMLAIDEDAITRWSATPRRMVGRIEL